MVNKILAIQNCGPSGTLLLQSLLDGHPQILSLPALHGQQLLIQWEKLQNKDPANILNQLIEDNEYWFTPEKQPGEDLGLTSMGKDFNEKVGVTKEDFIKYFSDLTSTSRTMTRKEFICAIFIAYNKARGIDTNKAEYILYPIHCLPQRYAKQLTQDFPVVRFLHTIRNSVQSMGSMAKHIQHNKGWQHLYLLNCVTAQMLNDFTIHAGPHKAFGMQAYFADTQDESIQTRAVRLEDLHKSLPDTMSSVCQWLNLTWDNCLLSSTFDGKQWNNRPASIRQNGAGNNIIAQQHQDILSKFDKFRLELLSSSYLFHYQYKKNLNIIEKISSLFMPVLILFPFKMENLKNNLQYHYELLNVAASEKPNIRWRYSKLGRLLAHRFTQSRLIDRVIVTTWYFKEYTICRLKQLLPITLKLGEKKEYIQLLSTSGK